MDVEKCFEFGWDVLEKRENSVLRMLVAESVENEDIFGYEGIAVSWNPISYSRLNTPRKRIKLKTKKAIAHRCCG
jgi:hypothetical protein